MSKKYIDELAEELTEETDNTTVDVPCTDTKFVKDNLEYIEEEL